MRTVLGVDAAWTLRQPSGVALASREPGGWHIKAAEASYQRFLARAQGRHPEPRPSGGQPDAAALLAAASELCGGRPVDLVAIDIPLALSPIVGRRAADDAVSKVYGGRKCGTHSPSAERPGRISDEIRATFAQVGYLLLTSATLSFPGLIEVYPHPALVELAGAPERLPYKLQKIRNYWPPAALLRPIRTGVDLALAARGAPKLQADVGHGRVRRPPLHVEHGLTASLSIRGITQEACRPAPAIYQLALPSGGTKLCGRAYFDGTVSQEAEVIFAEGFSGLVGDPQPFGMSLPGILDRRERIFRRWCPDGEPDATVETRHEEHADPALA